MNPQVFSNLRILHVLGNLEAGGVQRGALQLIRWALKQGAPHSLLLYDQTTPIEDAVYPVADIPLLNMVRGSGLDLRFARRLSRVFAHDAIDLVHARNETAMVYAVIASRMLRPRRRPKIVASMHNLPTHATRSARWLAYYASKKCSAIVTVSDELRAQLLTQKWVKKALTIPNGVDTSAFQPSRGMEGMRQRLQIPSDAFHIGHVGRCVPLKRQFDLVAVAKQWATDNPNAVFSFVGDGPLSEELRAQAETLPNARYLPSVDTMPEFYRSLDAFVLCSDHEAAPRSLLEAMASGVASVVTPVGGIPNIVAEKEHQSCAVQVPCRSPTELSAALMRLASDHKLRRELGDRAVRRAHELSAVHEWSAYRQLYEKVAADSAEAG